MRKVYFILLALFLTTCTKEVFVIEVPENPIINLPPGEFQILVGKITDNNISLSWSKPIEPENSLISYEIALNDSVIAYDLKQNSYIVNKLNPDKDYLISVLAVDKQRNKRIISKIIHTEKSFIEQIISYDFGYKKYFFDTAIETSEKGFLIYGHVQQEGIDRRMLILKLAPDYSISWKQEFDFVGDNNYAQQLFECSDHNFLIVRDKTILKINSQGNTIWSYQSENNDIMYFRSAVENKDGSIYLTGFFANVSMPEGLKNRGEYFLIKLSTNGIELFRKISNTSIENRIQRIIINDNNLLLLGTINNILSLSELDIEGNLIKTRTYPNKYNCGDMPHSLMVTPDNNLILLSTIDNYHDSETYYGSTAPRFLKIKKDGSVIWDQYHHLVSSGFTPSLNCLEILNTGQYLTVFSDDRGISLVLLNSQGNLEKHFKLPGYTAGKLIRYNTKGQYVYLSNTGEIVSFNPDGYNE